MKNFVTVAAFAAGANALVGRSSSCCFHIDVSGGSQGSLGQLGDGQNRVGDDSLAPAQYCIDSSGGITDANGRGCILTPPTTQFQCDQGAKPTPGFSVNDQGQIEYNGSTQFYACETGQNNGLNIYTHTDENQTGCRPVQMAADSCSGSGTGASPSGGGSSSPSSSSWSVPSSPSPRPSESSSSVPSVPSGGGAGGGGGSSSMPSAPASSSSQVTVWTTRTSSICPSTSSVPSMPSVPVQTPSSPAGGGGGGSSPSQSVPMQTPTSPAGGGGGGSSPSQSVPMQTPSSPAGGGGGGSSPSQSAPQPSSSSPSGGGGNGGGSGNSCPTNLNGQYSAPHLIVPVDSSKPDNAPGTSYNGTISSSKTTLYNFDIPQSYESKTCSLVFLFPKQEDLETSAFTFSGDGKIDFAKLQSPVQESTSYSNMPSVEKDYGVTTVSPGNSYTISTFSCPAGQTVAYEMKNAGSTYLDFFEDYNPSPLGLYITTC